MADVRSLLRNERASRRITHPHATYSTTGTLVCLVCHIQLKSKSLWPSHLNSAQHAMRLQRIRDGTLGRPPGAPEPPNGDTAIRSNKKRKADDGEADDRKRVKAANGLPEGFFDGDQEANESTATIYEPEEQVEESLITTPQIQTLEEPTRESTLPINSHNPTVNLPSNFFDSSTNTPTINESEWAAFEQDIATLAPAPLPSALTAAATITAAPLTAAELVARSREEASTQGKERREAELEEEKEDASRRLEEEFDEMEVLEKRVQRLREKREEIRRTEKKESVRNLQVEREMGDKIGKPPAGNEEEEEEDDEDEDEDWDVWGLH